MMEVMTGMDSDERLWEARLVADVRAGVRLAENELYAYCADYFWRKYRGVFFVGEEEAAEIFQDAFIALWEHISTTRETGRCWTSFATLWPECRIGVERFSPSSTMRRRISTRSWKSCRPSAARTPSRPRSINVWRD